MKVLAGDIGGTKTVLRIVDAGGQKVLHESRYSSQEYDEFDSMITGYLKSAGDLASEISRACLGVAGPILRNDAHSVAEVTNLPWQLDNLALASLTGIPAVYLINDFEAIGYGIGSLGRDQLFFLQDKAPRPHAARLIVGAGTGLGVALLRDDDGMQVLPSQGGHTSFAPANRLEDELLGYWRPSLGRVSWEHLVSGPGLVRIYDFLHHRDGADDNARHREIMASADHAAAITSAAEAGDELCEEALSLFVRFYGRATGDLALVGLPFGGVYLAGGIAPKIAGRLADGTFMEAFHEKGVMTTLMESFPVAVVLDPLVGITGAAVYGANAR